MLPLKQKKEAKEFFSGTCDSRFILTFGNESNRIMKAVNWNFTLHVIFSQLLRLGYDCGIFERLIYRGYYMAAQRYEISFEYWKISEWAQRTSEIFFSTQE